MKITLSRVVPQHPDQVIAAGAKWLNAEGTGIAPVRAELPDGGQSVGIDQLVDGVLISTAIQALPVTNGTEARLVIRMRGTSLDSKLRNVGMLLATSTVKRQATAQFALLLDTLESV